MATRTNTAARIMAPEFVNTATQGVVAGLIGGAVFGVQMISLGMLPMVADMVNSTSLLVGFILHMLISATIGLSYTFVAEFIPQTQRNWPAIIGTGIVFGVIWWVLGALIAMPTILGMSDMVLVIEDPQIMSLNGHIIFGIVLAAFYAVSKKADLNA